MQRMLFLMAWFVGCAPFDAWAKTADPRDWRNHVRMSLGFVIH